MNSYTPKVGDKVIVDFADLGLSAESIAEVAPDGSWVLLFQGEPGEQLASRGRDGMWRLQESGNDVFLLDPHARPERGGTGFVIPAEGAVEEWGMDAERDPGCAEGFLHAEQAACMAHIQEDGTWIMNEKDQIFFISAEQQGLRNIGEEDVECEGHCDSLDGANMGVTTYCDGTCR